MHEKKNIYICGFTIYKETYNLHQLTSLLIMDNKWNYKNNSRGGEKQSRTQNWEKTLKTRIQGQSLCT